MNYTLLLSIFIFIIIIIILKLLYRLVYLEMASISNKFNKNLFINVGISILVMISISLLPRYIFKILDIVIILPLISGIAAIIKHCITQWIKGLDVPIKSLAKIAIIAIFISFILITIAMYVKNYTEYRDYIIDMEDYIINFNLGISIFSYSLINNMQKMHMHMYNEFIDSEIDSTLKSKNGNTPDSIRTLNALNVQSPEEVNSKENSPVRGRSLERAEQNSRENSIKSSRKNSVERNVDKGKELMNQVQPGADVIRYREIIRLTELTILKQMNWKFQGQDHNITRILEKAYHNRDLKFNRSEISNSKLAEDVAKRHSEWANANKTLTKIEDSAMDKMDLDEEDTTKTTLDRLLKGEKVDNHLLLDVYFSKIRPFALREIVFFPTDSEFNEMDRKFESFDKENRIIFSRMLELFLNLKDDDHEFFFWYLDGFFSNIYKNEYQEITNNQNAKDRIKFAHMVVKAHIVCVKYILYMRLVDKKWLDDQLGYYLKEITNVNGDPRSPLDFIKDFKDDGRNFDLVNYCLEAINDRLDEIKRNGDNDPNTRLNKLYFVYK